MVFWMRLHMFIGAPEERKNAVMRRPGGGSVCGNLKSSQTCIFVWIVFHDAIVCLANLVYQKSGIDIRFARCGLEETSSHILFNRAFMRLTCYQLI